MQALILMVIRTLGRYAVILLAIPAVAITIAWFSLLQDHLVAFLVLGPFVIPLFTGSTAMLIGLLFSGVKTGKGPFVERATAPKIWAIWDELAPPRRGERRFLKIDERLNASIGERRRYLGLFGREVVMTVGVPLMALLDEPGVRSVIAHEIGHAEMKHTAGGTRLVEFERSFETVFDFLPIDRSISGGLLYALFGGVSDWLKAEMHRLAWQAEFEADAVAARDTGRDNAGQMLSVIEGAAHFNKERIIDPTQKRLIGTMAVPPAPVRRFLDSLAEIRDPAVLYAGAEIEFGKTADPSSSHPPIAERLKALGFDHVPQLKQLGASSLAILIPADLTAALLQDFESRWDRTISAHLNLH